MHNEPAVHPAIVAPMQVPEIYSTREVEAVIRLTLSKYSIFWIEFSFGPRRWFFIVVVPQSLVAAHFFVPSGTGFSIPEGTLV
jgi:hypothetical protein